MMPDLARLSGGLIPQFVIPLTHYKNTAELHSSR